MPRFPILAVVGTRPEAIKMAPLISTLQRHGAFEVRLCATAQHRDMLDTMLKVFNLEPDYDLNVMRPNQSLNGTMTKIIVGIDKILNEWRPGLILVQGDTTSALAAALAAFQCKVPVGHVEAGLRSFNRALPFPEEMNRELVDRASELLFAPTMQAKDNLLKEGIAEKRIFVTGNTGIDAVLEVAAQPAPPTTGRLSDFLKGTAYGLITLHRRESFGAPMREIMGAIRMAADRHPNLRWLYPVHPNPNVRRTAKLILRHPRILLTAPLGYKEFVHAMKGCSFIVTDSGGIQEEAPSLGKPVLVVRETTERAECLTPGMSRLVGTTRGPLLSGITALVSRPSSGARIRNPVGDGRASARIVKAIQAWRGKEPRPAPFR